MIPMQMSLAGVQLIEASAGTGKTWTIAALYLRLILAGHHPEDILVMTFTRAATHELKTRIRERLIEAVQVLRGERAPDPFLEALGNSIDPTQAAWPQAALRLEMAAQSMDSASIMTIDAWCQRMLREHALPARSDPSLDIDAEAGQRQRQACENWWRREVYALGEAAGDAWCAHCPTPAALEARLFGKKPAGQVLAWRKHWAQGWDVDDCLRQWPPLSGAVPEAGSMDGHWQQWDSERQRLQAELLPLLATQIRQVWDYLLAGKKQKPARFGATLRSDWTQQVHDLVDAWSQGEWMDPPSSKKGELPSWWKYLSRAKLSDCVKQPGDDLADAPAALDAWPDLWQRWQQCRDVQALWDEWAWPGVQRELERSQREAGVSDFNGLLRQLRRAIRGSEGDALVSAMRRQYPVLMVDEFQDTSLLQFEVFERVFIDRPDGLCVMIGDPKQSIYAFRGADIDSYLSARPLAQSGQWTLDTNFRSSVAMVAAANAWLTVAAKGSSEAPFFMGSAEGTQAPRIAFEPVKAQGRPRQWMQGQRPAPALTLFTDWRQALPKPQWLRLMAQHATAHVLRCLDPAEGFAWEDAGGVRHRMEPGDVAVLVHDGWQAQAIQAELAKAGLSSVYLSEKQSVWKSTQAQDLNTLLEAVLDPLDPHKVRNWMACDLRSISWEALPHEMQDRGFEAAQQQLMDWREQWSARGPMCLLRSALQERGLGQRLLARSDGERAMTNVLHLAELLQSSSRGHRSPEAQLRWFQQELARADAKEDLGEGRTLRLESDARVIQILTVHKSKGLEFPLVLLPFGGRPPRSPTAGAGDEEDSAEDLQAASLQEEARLLYVALTRARFATWIGLGWVRSRKKSDGPMYGFEKTALGRWLGLEDITDMDDARRRIQSTVAAMAADIDAAMVDRAGKGLAVAQSAEALHWTDVQEAAGTQTPTCAYASADPPSPVLAAPAMPHYPGPVDRSWRLSSFSALVKDKTHLAPLWPRPGSTDALASGERGWMEDESALVGTGSVLAMDAGGSMGWGLAQASAASQDMPSWRGLPKGPQAGNRLHEMMEWAALTGYDAAQSEVWRQRWLARSAFSEGVSAAPARAQEALWLDWMEAIWSTPLDALGASLSQTRHWRPEMEFWMPLDELQTEYVQSLSETHWWPGQARPRLAQRQMRGLLMGFMDLVFEYQGKWWVLDYKSNHLGSQHEDYAHPHLVQAMLHHRYDLQAGLYMMALHRVLQRRLGASYRPQEHLGGAIHWFVRGIGAPGHGALVMPVPPGWLEGLSACFAAGSLALGADDAQESAV